MSQREALEEPGCPEEDAGLMDMAMSGSGDQYETYGEDEDQMYMQQAPNDTLLALQLLRSQFPAKARVGTSRCRHMLLCCKAHSQYTFVYNSTVKTVTYLHVCRKLCSHSCCVVSCTALLMIAQWWIESWMISGMGLLGKNI